MSAAQPIIAVRGLAKTFKGVRVLDSIDLEVRPHEKVVVIGQSGSGKSTLIRCLNGLVEPDEGTVAIEGASIDTHSREEWRKLRQRVGMVFQDYSLFPHLTVLRNITLAPMRAGLCDRAEAEGRARGLLRRVRLPEKENAYPAELSGGQQQRVAIARALAMQPKIMLFDEPTSALDPETIKEVLDLMRKLAADGMTMIVVTHEMGFAQQVADRVVFLDRGRVVEQGPPAQLFPSPREQRTRDFLAKIL